VHELPLGVRPEHRFQIGARSRVCGLSLVMGGGGGSGVPTAVGNHIAADDKQSRLPVRAGRMEMNESELRRATAAHAEKLTALARAAYARHVPVIGREPMPMTADWARLLDVRQRTRRQSSGSRR
jgi:hypothetical protein